MGNVLYLAYVLLFLITGIATSYGDVFRKKVVNTWLVWSMRNALVLFVLFLVLSFLNVRNIIHVPFGLFQLTLFRDILINVFGAAALGYLFWYIGVWAAGDAKLFILYALLIPLPFYSGTYIKYVPSFVLLLNTFLPVFLYVLGAFLLHSLGSAIRWGAELKKGSDTKLLQWRAEMLRRAPSFCSTVFIRTAPLL